MEVKSTEVCDTLDIDRVCVRDLIAFEVPSTGFEFICLLKR